MKNRSAIYWLSLFFLSSTGFSQLVESYFWDDVQRLDFSLNELPPNLYSEFTGKQTESYLQYCLPRNYRPEKNYPLLVYVPGLHGHPGGNIKNALDIANARECVVLSLPLFKTKLDRTEPGKGLIIGFSDYPALSRAYKAMLEKFFARIPNIDRSKSAMVGFSNGAIAIGILVSMNDEYILNHFNSFCLVDFGMFHLADLHKSPTKDKRFLILVGGKEGPGTDLKIRGARLIEGSYRQLGCRIESRILKNTGHELTESCKLDIGRWVFEEDSTQSPSTIFDKGFLNQQQDKHN